MKFKYYFGKICRKITTLIKSKKLVWAIAAEAVVEVKKNKVEGENLSRYNWGRRIQFHNFIKIKKWDGCTYLKWGANNIIKHCISQ